MARQKILIYFNEIFDAICKLFADPDVNVTNGAKLLDRLIKDIVTESDQGLDVERFIGLLQVMSRCSRTIVHHEISTTSTVTSLTLYRREST